MLKWTINKSEYVSGPFRVTQVHEPKSVYNNTWKVFVDGHPITGFHDTPRLAREAAEAFAMSAIRDALLARRG